MRKFDKCFLILCGILMPMLIALGMLAGFGEAMTSFSPSHGKSADGVPTVIAWLYRYPLPATGTIAYVMNGIFWSLVLSALIALIGTGRLWGRRSDV